MVGHPYMGPVPAMFYPMFQLVDYAVHAWMSAKAPGSRTRSTATRPTCSSP